MVRKKDYTRFVKLILPVDKWNEYLYNNTSNVQWPRGVAVNMSPCHGEDRRFKSVRGRHASVAQSVEQRTENPCVGSSILP